MKKIGIMSMQRIQNYGSFLQAYGLKKTIESLGYSVCFVDYKYENPVIDNKNDGSLKRLIRKIKRNVNFFVFFRNRQFNKKWNNIFKESCKKYLNIGNYYYAYNKIDELVIGSDEVFNCLQGFPVGYSRELFGKNYESIPVISYAACFGNASLDRIKEYKIDNEIGEMLSKFKAISVRDSNSFNIVYELTKNKPFINLDPVLITDFSKETIDNVKIKDYILLYAYSGRLTKGECKYIKNFAKKNKKKIVSIGTFQKIADYNFAIDPFEIFAYFKHADFVITDTFHGTIFSIKTHTNFATIIRNGKIGNSNKLEDLLDRIGKKENIIKNIQDINNIYKNNTDFTSIDKILKRETKKSVEYLKNNLIM